MHPYLQKFSLYLSANASRIVNYMLIPPPPWHVIVKFAISKCPNVLRDHSIKQLLFDGPLGGRSIQFRLYKPTNKIFFKKV